MKVIWEGEVSGVTVRVVVSHTDPIVIYSEKRYHLGNWIACDDYIAISTYKKILTEMLTGLKPIYQMLNRL
jgi:hypothetical protein